VDETGGSGRAAKKNGKQRGAENVVNVAEYLDRLDRTGELVPLNPDGSPNYSEIARHCGFGRQVFYTNETARALVEQRIQRFTESRESRKVKTALHRVDAQDRHIQRIEEKVATLSAEVEALRRQNHDLRERLRQYEVMEEVLDVGRYRP